MKKIAILISLFVITVTNLYSQNSVDPTILITQGDTIIDFNNTNVFAKNINGFTLGWNYGMAGRQLDTLMKTNMYLHGWKNHNDTIQDLDWANRGTNHNWYLTITPLNQLSDRGVVGVQSMYYEPSIVVDRTDNFTPGSNHIEGAVFGFQNKHPNITNSGGKAVINTNVVTSLPVLSDVWPKNELKFWNNFENYTRRVNNKDVGYEREYGKGDQRNGYNGREWFLSINLKSLTTLIPPHLLDVPLITLKIKMYPHYFTPDTTFSRDTVKPPGYIKFSSIPRKALDSIINAFGTNLGRTRGDSVLTVPTRDFVITPRMLITQAPNTANQAITLSAGFGCFYASGQYPFDITHFGNPYLPNLGGVLNDPILNRDYTWVSDSLDIEVYYNSGAGIGTEISWIRLEVPKARELFRGAHDSYVRMKVWQARNYFLTQPENAGHRIAGFYANDEYEQNLWSSSRYFNMLVDTMSNAEINTFGLKDENIPSQFLHATGYKSYWNGVNLTSAYETAAPYIRLGSNLETDTIRRKHFGYMSGYGGNDTLQFSDTDIFNSKYETWLPMYQWRINGILDNRRERSSFEITDLNSYNMPWNDSLYIRRLGKQYANERTIYRSYYQRQSLLFGNKPWIAWLWINTAPWKFDSIWGSIYNNGGKPQTGEEIRFQLFQPLALGAKGEMFWWKVKGDNDYFETATRYIELTLQPSQRPDFLNILNDIPINNVLNHPVMYDDFIDFSLSPTVDTIYRFSSHYNSSLYEWRKLGLEPSQRVYIGLNSIRQELFKHNTWVRHNETLLNDLELIAWYGKGHAEMYSQKDGYEPNLIDKYVNRADILTRPIGREINGVPLFEQGDIDSGMYDITILRASEIGIDKEIILTCINRRTDPLVYNADNIYWESPDTYDNGWIINEGFKFYSTYEYDTFSEVGGNIINPDPDSENTIDVHRDAPYWRDLFWKRQGCREISLKFNTIDASKNIYYKVEEITDGTEFSETLPWWKKDEISKRVKKLIQQGERLTLDYLPGSGRMFRINIIHDTTKALIGELAFSNQTKIIAYPAHQESNYDFWKDTTTQELNFYKDSMMYYHIVYDREYNVDKSRVYYRRSAKPYDRTVNTKIIEWGPEILLSDTIVFWRDLHYFEAEPTKDSVHGIAGSSISCKYPAIVVRYDDTTDIVRVYVVFSCNLPQIPSINDSCRIFMVESVFPHDTLLPPSSFKVQNNLEPIAWGRVGSIELSELDKYGGVSINASHNGNYYAFCDTALGIGVGFKTTNDRGFLTNRRYIKYNLSGICSQPALNTYSRLNINEDNCALVFKEKSEGQDRIIYTRLHNPLGQINNYVPINFCDPDYIYQMSWLGWDIKTALINVWDIPEVKFNAEYPAVYRPVEFARRPGFEVADSLHYVGACWDRVYWHANVGSIDGKKSIFMKNIDIADNLDCWYMLPELQLMMTNANLAQPSPGPGAPSSITSGTFSQFALSDSSFILNFIKYQLFGLPGIYSDVYQINFNAWMNYFDRWDGDTIYHEVNLQWWSSVGQGMYPHTTHTPVITENRDWYIHNRIYQSSGNQIKTSAKLFLKGEQDQKTIYPLLSLSDENSKSQISEIFTLGNSIESRYTSIGLKAFGKDENGRIKRNDTIVSNWFRIDAIKELAFYSILSDTTLFSFELEDNNGKSLKLPMSKDRSSSLNSRKITFLNGKNKEYRIKLTKKSKDVSVWLDLLFDDKRDLSEEVSDYSSKELQKSNVEYEPKHQIYDLSDHEITSGEMMNLKTYPNPAGDYIYVSCELLTSSEQISDVHYTLFNSTGRKVFESTSKESITIIHTDDLPSGVYFLKAEQLEFDMNSDVKPFVTKTVIIQR